MLTFLPAPTAPSLPAGWDLSVADPRVIGSIGAFVLIAFVLEIIVSGRSHKRELAERDRLRALVEKTVIPLAESMTATVKEHTETLERLVDIVEELTAPSPRPRTRRTNDSRIPRT